MMEPLLFLNDPHPTPVLYRSDPDAARLTDRKGEGAMKVSFKEFDVEMALGNKGIELDVSGNEGHKGDLVITKTQLIWCEGRTRRENGTSISWQDFIDYMENRPK
jgi:hypothetical protein